MKVNDNDLINKYRAYIKAKSLPSRRKCPSREDMVKAFSPKTGEKQKTKIIDHISRCHNCAQEFDIIRQIFKASQGMDKEMGTLLSSEEEVEAVIERANRVVSKTKKQQKLSLFPFIRVSPKYLSWAAGMMVLVIGVILILKFSGLFYERQIERGPEKIKVELIEPKEGKNLKKSLKGELVEALIFKWDKFPETKYYVFKLFKETLILIYESDKIFNHSLNLPAHVLKGLEKNKTYFWMVTAFSRTEKKVESDLQDFRLIDE
jgi:hypothetical protein